MNFRILNKKEYTNLLNRIKEQFQIKDLNLDYGFIQNKEKIYLISKDLSKIDYKKTRFNNLGLYFCTLEKDGIRLSIEGAQLIGKNVGKILELNEKETKRLFLGEDIENKEGFGYVIIKNKKDILGCGKLKDNKLLNYTPKERRGSII